MPFLDTPIPPEQSGFRTTPENLTPPASPEGGTVAAAFRLENDVVSAYNYLTERSGFINDPNHNPMDLIKGTRYESDYLYRFVDSRSEADTRARMTRIDREETDRKILDAAGLPGLVAQVGAGLLSPALFLPAGTIYRGARTGRAIAASAGSTAAYGAAALGLQEGVLYGSQETRTGLESTLNIATGTIAAGILGAAIGGLTRKEFTKIVDVMEAARADINTELAPGGAGRAAAAGAASAQREGLTLAPALGLERATSGFSPVTRLQTSEFETARATVRDLADAGLSYKENWEGVPTSEGGTVETRVKLRRGPMIDAIDAMDDAYARYFFGTTDVTQIQKKTAGVRAAWANTLGPEGGKLTPQQFREEIGKAMRRGDQHDIPEVAEAAKRFRSQVFDPLKDEAIRLGLLEEGVDTLGAMSYLTRVYNRDRIVAQRDTWQKILVDHWKREAVKSNEEFAKRRAANLADIDEKIAKLEETPPIIADPQATKVFDEQAAAERQFLTETRDTELEVLKTDRDRQIDALNSQAARLRNEIRGERGPEARARRTEIAAQLREGKSRVNQKYDTDLAKARDRFEKESAKLEKKLEAEYKKLVRGMTKDANVQAEIDKLKKSRVDMENRQNNVILAGKTDAELQDLANEITNTILGESAFRLPGLSILQGPQGPLKARVLNIPDFKIEDFLESDAEKIARVYTTSMAGDIEMTAKFGDVKLEGQLKTLLDEFNAKVAKTPPGQKGERQRVKLQKQYERAKADLEGLRDRVRGMENAGVNVDSLMYRAGKVALNLNYIARLGGATISSITDLGRAVARYGLTKTFSEGWTPFVTNMAAVKMSAKELRLAGTALELVRDQRSLTLADLMDDYGRNSKFERGVQYLADRFSTVNLMAQWQGNVKLLTGMVTMSEVLRSVKAVSEGTASAKDIARLAENGVSEAMAKRIWNQAQAPGGHNVVKGMTLPNTEGWTDLKAIEAFRATINREVDNLIVTPGLEKPFWISTPVGRIVGQFKTFSLVSTQRILLAGLQQRDAEMLAGALSMLALGAMVAHLKAMGRGEDTQKWTPGQWAGEALDNSGLMGIFGEVNATAEKLTRGRVGLSVLTGKEVSRYASRNAVGALLGPTADFVRDLSTIGGLGADDWSRSDTKALRKVVPFQNVFYLRQLFDMAEESVNDYFRIPERQVR